MDLEKAMTWLIMVQVLVNKECMYCQNVSLNDIDKHIVKSISWNVKESCMVSNSYKTVGD